MSRGMWRRPANRTRMFHETEYGVDADGNIVGRSAAITPYDEKTGLPLALGDAVLSRGFTVNKRGDGNEPTLDEVYSASGLVMYNPEAGVQVKPAGS